MSRNDLSIFNNSVFDVFDSFFNEDFFHPFERRSFLYDGSLSTDVVENDDNYELIIDVPGIKKDELSIELDDGYLSVIASKKENKKDNRKYLHKERGECYLKRSFFVGDVNTDNVKAKMDDGELHLFIPKEQQIITKKTINID